MSERLLLRVEEVAEMLSLGRSKTYQLIASGVLPGVRLGRCVRVPADALRVVKTLAQKPRGNLLAPRPIGNLVPAFAADAAKIMSCTIQQARRAFRFR